MPLSFQFFSKNICSHAHILSKNVHSLKRSVFSYHFFQFFYEKIRALMPIIGQQNVYSVNTTLYYGPKSWFHEKKNNALMPVFGQQTSIF